MFANAGCFGFYSLPFFPWGSIFFGFLIFILLTFLVIYFYRYLMHQKNQSNDQLETVLKLRYAKGEITKEEYDAKKRELL